MLFIRGLNKKRTIASKLLAILACATLAVMSNAALVGINERDWVANIVATDSSWFYKNLDGTYNEDGNGHYPELELTNTRSFQINKVVYVRGTTATINLTLKNYSFWPQACHMQIEGVRLAVPPPYSGGSTTYINLAYTGDNTAVSLPGPFGWTSTSFTVTLPNYVTFGDLQIIWGVTSDQNNKYIGGSGTEWQTWERLYVTLSTPQGIQAVPWTDLLEYSCSWARDDTSATEASQDLTFGLYWDSRWQYTDGDVFYYLADDNEFFLDDDLDYDDGSGDGYDLSGALTNLNGLNMDCKDASGFLSLSMASQGLSNNLYRLFAPNEQELLFKTNPLCGMGSDATDDGNYENYDWGHHQVTNLSSQIYDAAGAQKKDLSAQGYRNPPSAWPENDYWQKPWENGYFLGLVFGYQNSSTPCPVTKFRVVRNI